jgi:hypothetical protein
LQILPLNTSTKPRTPGSVPAKLPLLCFRLASRSVKIQAQALQLSPLFMSLSHSTEANIDAATPSTEPVTPLAAAH